MRPFPGGIKEVPWKFLNDAVPVTGFKGLEQTDRKSGEQYPKVSSHLTGPLHTSMAMLPEAFCNNNDLQGAPKNCNTSEKCYSSCTP